jgi:hypothetical protein
VAGVAAIIRDSRVLRVDSTVPEIDLTISAEIKLKRAASKQYSQDLVDVTTWSRTEHKLAVHVPGVLGTFKWSHMRELQRKGQISNSIVANKMGN